MAAVAVAVGFGTAAGDVAQPSGRGYRPMLIAVDLMVIAGSTLLWLSDQEDPALAVAGVGFLGGGPLVHALQGQPSRAAASAGLRAGGLGGGGRAAGPVAAGLNSGPSGERDKCALRSEVGLALGAPLGGLAAVIIDATILGGAPRGPTASPSIVPAPGGAVAGVTGSF